MDFKTARNATMAALMGGLVALSGGCDDLSVNNPNEPDRDRALATATDVASLIGGSFRSYYFASQGWGGGAAVGMASASDEISSSWGNVGMQDFGKEPRIAIDNSPVYSYAGNVENGWYNAYSAVVAASDGLRAMQEREEVGNALGPAERAFANFAQGLGLGWLALQYDQAVIWDETKSPTEEQSISPYTAVMDAALANMQEALDIAAANSFSTTDAWMNGRSLSSDELSGYIHALMARWMASVNRTPSEAAGRSPGYWQDVIDHVDQGFEGQAFTIPASTDDGFWSGIKSYGGTFDGFVRSDYRNIGPADVSGGYQQWEATPASQRQPFNVETPDRRITGSTPTSPGLYMFHAGASPFPEIRGTYYWSNYGDYRYAAGYPQYGGHACFGFCGDQPLMTKTELDLLKAEAHLMRGEAGMAVPLINATRVGNGQLPPVDENGTDSNNADCVPKGIDGTCGDLMEALQHEKRMEVYQVSGGISYFDDRRWGDLLQGTAFHFPVPGTELGALGMDFYTYGGGGEGSAAAVPIPGQDGADIMDRVRWSLDALARFQEPFTKPPEVAVDGKQ